MSADLKVGDRFLDRFRVEHLAAEGGMASIYAATDEQTGHRVALKVLYPYYSDNAIIRTRFFEEGRIQQQLRHPNIIRVFAMQDIPTLAILMEFVEGPTLDDFLASHGPLNTEEVIDVIIPVMSAVGFAHSQGVIHRDLKPSNILLPNADLKHPKVLDFGVAKIKGGRHDLTATGTTVGTLHYMSPEQIVGSKSIDGRADIYSIGVMMYKLVTGEVPFNAPTEFALMMAQVEAAPLPPSKLRANVHPQLERVILKAMEKKAQDRFQTIRDFTQALLDLRLNAQSTVGDTMSARISSELLNFAIGANEIAVDRSADDNLGITDRIEAVSAPLDQATAEIEATLKIDRRPMASATPRPLVESTTELSNSSIVRISGSSMMLNDDSATASMTGLRDRLAGEDATRLTPPGELRNLISAAEARDFSTEKTMETREAPVRTAMPNPQNSRREGSGRVPAPLDLLEVPTQQTPLYPAPEQTRPSKPSALVKNRGSEPPPLESEEVDTVSVVRPVNVETVRRAEGARSGVVTMDPHADSRDLTAPQLSREQLRAFLPQELGGDVPRQPSGRHGAERPNDARQDSGRQPVERQPSGRQPAVDELRTSGQGSAFHPQAGAPAQPSGPKMVLGKQYADTDENTREKPAHLKGSIPPPQYSPQQRSGYQPSPSSMPGSMPAQMPHQPAPMPGTQDDGRIQQRVARNVGPTVPANEMPQLPASALPSPPQQGMRPAQMQPPLSAPAPGSAPRPGQNPSPHQGLQAPSAQPEQAPEVNKTWLVLGLVALLVILLAAIAVVGGVL